MIIAGFALLISAVFALFLWSVAGRIREPGAPP